MTKASARGTGGGMLEGLPPNNASFVARLACDAARAMAIADIVVETFEPAEAAASAFERNPNSASWAAQDWIVEIFFADRPDEEELARLIEAATGERAPELAVEPVAAADWIAASLHGLKPVEAGRFVVHGAHDRKGVPAHRIGLEIEAALAFGTGHHGTTRGCLMMLEQTLRRRRPRTVADIGTGTGVLALAAARALRAPVAAADIDPVAIAAARANARRNAAHPNVSPVVATGARHAVFPPGRFDLVFANILAKPLRLMATELSRIAAPGGELILSGLLAGDVAGVLSAYAARGFRLARRADHEGWATLLLRRGGSARRPRRS